jgi:hypothetical protein
MKATAAADQQAVESLLARGDRALTVEGDLGAARRWFELAYAAAERADDTVAMASAVLGQCGLRVQEQRGAAGPVTLGRLRALLPRIDPASPIGLRVRVRLAAESDYREGRQAAILALLAEATEAGDPLARASALNLAGHCLLGPGPGRSELRRALAVELIAESDRTGRRSDLLMGLVWQAVSHFLDGDRHAERRLAELREVLAAGDHLAVRYLLSGMEVMLAIRAGELGRAEQQAQDCRRLGEAAGDVDATVFHTGHLMVIRLYQGRFAELLPTLAEQVHSPGLSAVDNTRFGALAAAAAMAGDLRTAAGAVATLGRDLAQLPRAAPWLSTMHILAEAAYLLGDTETATQVSELLTPYEQLPVIAGLATVCVGSVRHALGVAALTTGELDLAVEHLRAAVRDNLALRHWPAVVWSRLRYAQALCQRGHVEDLVTGSQESAAAQRDADLLGVALPGRPPAADQSSTMEPVATCTRDGRDWLITHGARRIRVPHAVGMLHLAVLLANPGTEVPAIELVVGPATTAATIPSARQPVLDRAAAQQYRTRLAELRDRIDDLTDRGRTEQAAEAKAEHEWLVATLSSAAGLSGRPRQFSDEHERARLAVGRAIRRSLAAISARDSSIGEHLAKCVHTGARCCYRPASV